DAWATVTVAEALWLLSATLVAMTWKVPALAGAVYTPEPLMVPPGAPSWTDQLTAVDWPPPVPVTEAVKFTTPPVAVEAEAGARGNGDRDVRCRADVDRGRRALRGVGEAGGGDVVGAGSSRSGVPPGTVDAAAARAFLDGPGHLRGLTSAGAGDRRTEAGDAS